jgi:hypothetical protein
MYRRPTAAGSVPAHLVISILRVLAHGRRVTILAVISDSEHTHHMPCRLDRVYTAVIPSFSSHRGANRRLSHRLWVQISEPQSERDLSSTESSLLAVADQNTALLSAIVTCNHLVCDFLAAGPLTRPFLVCSWCA